MSGSSIYDYIPAGTPPPGVKSNFNDPITQQPALIGINVVFLTAMLIVVVIRIYVRGRILHTLGIDDYLCILAAMASVTFTAVILASFRVGLGRHLYDIPASMVMQPASIRLLNATSILVPASLYLVKLSILLLYKRLFTIGKVKKMMINITIGFVTVISLVYVIYNIVSDVECVGLYELENYALCKTLYHSTISQAVLNAITDIVILILPLREVSKLQVGRRQKFGIMAIFGVGLITIAMSIARVIYLTVFYMPEDALWYTALALNFGIVEINLAIICACAPTMPTFFKQTKQVGSRLLRTLTGRNASTNNSQGGPATGPGSGGSGGSSGNSNSKSKSNSNSKNNNSKKSPSKPAFEYNLKNLSHDIEAGSSDESLKSHPHTHGHGDRQYAPYTPYSTMMESGERYEMFRSDSNASTSGEDEEIMMHKINTNTKTKADGKENGILKTVTVAHVSRDRL